MYDVFISYRRSNGSDLASFINSDLTQKGFNCFFDIEQKYSGDFMKVVDESIKNSSLLLILITEGSLERFKDEKDITRIEVETAIKYGIDILPISVIGDKMFNILSEDLSLPDCARALKNFNCRLYKHELKLDTMNYIVEVLDSKRNIRFKEISSNALKYISKIEDKELKEYVSTVEGKTFDYLGRALKYTGPLKFGRLDGQGTLTDLANGLIYKMEWNPYGEYQGIGEVYKGSRLIYVGEINELKYDGKGKLYDNDFVYEGMFREGKLRGYGIMTMKDGTTYTGEWLAGVLYIKGHIRYSNGDEYWGKTNDNIPSGYGTLIKKSGIKFDGFFRRGIVEQGALYLHDGIFIGNFENEEPNGRGAMYTNQFKKLFEGTFKKGKLAGYGKFYLKGKRLSNIMPSEIYNRLKEYYPKLDTMDLMLSGKFDGINLLEYDDFRISDMGNMSTICEGHIKDSKLNEYRYNVLVDYEEVYSNSPVM